MTDHMLFSLLAWAVAIAARLYVKRFEGHAASPVPADIRGRYYLVALLGVGVGATLFGTLNLALFVPYALGHSVLGALIGGVIAVEYFKAQNAIKGSTGYAWVLPLSLGIALGRIGCFLAGMDDHTYGTPTALPWGVNFGDGVPRHPVQLYESLTMALFALGALLFIRRRDPRFRVFGFYIFVIVYGTQRFLWEFLKPYPAVLGPFNIFHIGCTLLVVYGAFMTLRTCHNHESARAP